MERERGVNEGDQSQRPRSEKNEVPTKTESGRLGSKQAGQILRPGKRLRSLESRMSGIQRAGDSG